MKTHAEAQETVTIGTASYDAMWADIAKMVAPQEPPPGSMSAEQFAKINMDGNTSAAKHFLNRQVNAGRMTSEMVHVVVNGVRRRVRYFVPISPVNQAGLLNKK